MATIITNPYCSLADFQVNSLGADISTIDATELTSILLDAKARADSYMQTTYDYQVRTEKHDWRGDWRNRWEAFPYFTPVRTVTSVKILVSAHAGAYSSWDIPCTPTDTQNSPPEVFGDIFIDRDIGYVQTTDILLKYGIGLSYIATPMNPPQFQITYTCGYNPPDANLAQYDNLNFPFPDWLVNGTRHIAAWLVEQRRLQLNGMGNLDELREGDRTYRRATSSRSAGSNDPTDIPTAAKRELQRGIVARFGGISGSR